MVIEIGFYGLVSQYALEQLQGRARIAPTLHREVQDLALVIDGASEIPDVRQPNRPSHQDANAGMARAADASGSWRSVART